MSVAPELLVARCLKEVISNSNILGKSILDFKYELIDINRYDKDYLYENNYKENIERVEELEKHFKN